MIGTKDIKVITGIRRCGKSELLNTFSAYLKENKDNNIIEVKLQQKQFESFLKEDVLYDYVMSKYDSSKNNYLLVDEIQLAKNFEKAINYIYEENKFDIYITGSNAFLLSSDLATLFTGRTFQIHVYPFSFKEMINYYNYNNYNEAFDEYVKFGGFAGSYSYRNKEDKYTYISNEIYNPIIQRDIVDRYKIKNTNTIENISLYLFDNISNLTSPNSITRYLNTNHDDITYKTVASYIDYIKRSFIVYEAKRYDLKGKKYLSTDSKYYLSDHSIRYAKNGVRNLDIGRVYENIVFIELLRRGYEVYIGKLYEKEVDFVATKFDEKIYIQVSNNINDENTFNREIRPLLSIKDAYPKCIIAKTYQDEYSYEGVRIIDIVDWLTR